MCNYMLNKIYNVFDIQIKHILASGTYKLTKLAAYGKTEIK